MASLQVLPVEARRAHRTRIPQVVSHHVGTKIKHRASEERQVLLTTEPCIQLQQMAREYRFSKSTYHI